MMMMPDIVIRAERDELGEILRVLGLPVIEIQMDRQTGELLCPGCGDAMNFAELDGLVLKPILVKLAWGTPR